MQYLDALQLIRKHYNTIPYSPDIEIIKINKLLDFSNYYFIVLLDNNGEAKLSDMGKTGEVIDMQENSWKQLSREFGIDYSDYTYTLSTKISSIEDLYRFILLLDKVAKDD